MEDRVHAITRTSTQALYSIAGLFSLILIGLSTPAFSLSKAETTFTAIMTDDQAVET